MAAADALDCAAERGQEFLSLAGDSGSIARQPSGTPEESTWILAADYAKRGPRGQGVGIDRGLTYGGVAWVG
jgi:hypothetical protein